ncbi:MAG TPA: HlyD family secretion protein [Ochrobactrum intermedium]|uniref:HlyD family secretion protein n=1 Tax=Brucella intermedia TaxID=94625 RepID=A0A7V6PCD4_9HYPH|nr:HlyD family secretion protein [Brucella intermedia]HHV68328.1 HlyD family secretion protein [Brucella intermedia]
MKHATTIISAGVIFFAVSGLAMAVVAPGRIIPRWSAETTDNAYIRGEITPISPKITGYLAEVAIEDNQAVRKGDVLFRVEDRDYLARVHQAEATLNSKQAAIGNLDSRLDLQRTMIQQAEAALDGAEADANRALQDKTRTQELRRTGTASQAAMERADAESRKTASGVAEARANLAAARSQLEVLESQRPQLMADIDVAEAAVELANTELDATVIRAPADGRVSERQARVGQYVRPGTQLIALVSSTVWAVANFKETQLRSIRVGDEALVAVDGVSGAPFRAQVESVSPASGAQFALLPPDNATGNFTRIVQRIPVRLVFASDDNDTRVENLRPGMSAIVTLTDRNVAQVHDNP